MRPEKGSDGVFDFDALVVEPRVVRVGGEEVDVSVIPMAVQMALAKMADRGKAGLMQDAEEDAWGSLKRTIEMVATVTVLRNPKVTADFLLDHLDFARLTEFAMFVLKPVRERAEELAGDEGNAVTESQSDSDDSPEKLLSSSTGLPE